MSNHDMFHTGASPFHGPSSPSIKWVFNTGVTVSGSPVIGPDGTVYAGAYASAGYLFAIRPDGTQKWVQTFQNPIEETPAVGSDGTIYVGTDYWGPPDEGLYAMNPDGSQKWEYSIHEDIEHWWVDSPMLGLDGTIYAFGYAGYVFCLDMTGNAKWVYFNYDPGETSTPTIGPDGTVYMGSYYLSGGIQAINPNGTYKWNYPGRYESPMVSPSNALIYTQSDKLYCLTMNNTQSYPSQAWTFNIGSVQDYPPSPSLYNGVIYLASQDGSLYAIGPNRLKKWSFATGGPILSSASIDGAGNAYVGSSDGCVYAISASGGLMWKVSTGAPVYSSPAIGSDNTIYVTSSNGKLYAIGPITLSGKVTLQSYTGDVTKVPMTVALRNQGSTVALETHTVNLGTDGSYSCSISTPSLASGSFTVLAKASHWLAQSVPLSTDTEGNGLASFMLLNGDINGDNFVEDQDYSLLGVAWHSSTGDVNYNPLADLNGDGVVEDQDYSIMGTNWYMEGDQ
jgi:outer membrane protein assembly factor BamB